MQCICFARHCMVLDTLAEVNSLLACFNCAAHAMLSAEGGHLTFFHQVIPGKVYLRSNLPYKASGYLDASTAYCAIRNKFTNIFWGPAPTLSSFFTLHDPKVIARFLRECFEHRNTLVATQTGHSL